MKNKTATEVEAKIASVQQDITKRTNAMTDMLNALGRKLNAEVSAEILREAVNGGEKCGLYSWTHERSYLPGRKCFTTQEPLLPGSKAYKGTLETGTMAELDEIGYPSEIWLTNEEFIVRKLQGQI